MTNGFEHSLEMMESGTTFHGDPEDDSSDSDTRVVLLYGGGNRTGRRATEQFLEIGAEVVVVDEPRYRDELDNRFGEDIDFLAVDPHDLQSTLDVAEEFEGGYGVPDVLASTKSAAYDLSGVGTSVDRTYAVNHLALYLLCYYFEDSLLHSRTLIPVHPIVEELQPEVSPKEQPDNAEHAFVRSQYANAALVVGLHIYNRERTTNAYDPGIVSYEESFSKYDQIQDASEPDLGAERLVHISSTGETGMLSGGYYGGSIEEIRERSERFLDQSNSWVDLAPADHVLPISRGRSEDILHENAEICEIDPDWYKSDAWYLDVEDGSIEY